MKKTVVKITFPLVKEFKDYHYIEEFADSLNMVSDKKIKYKELPGLFCDGWYVGLFYIGTMPNKEELDKMVGEIRNKK